MVNKLVDKNGLKKYHIGVNSPMVSPILTNTLTNKFKVGHSNDTHEDYTDSMCSGIVTLDEIGGVSVNENGKLVNLEIGNIYLSKSVIKLTPGNLYHILVGENHGYDLTDDTLQISSNKNDKYISVSHAFDGLKDGVKYTFQCDVSKIGSPTFTIEGCDNKGNFLDCFEYYSLTNGRFLGTFTYSDSGGVGFKVYSATNVASGGGTVILSGMKLIEHKPNTISPRVKLRSLPHGVCDFARGNKKIKHVDSIELTGSEPWELVDISKSNTNVFRCKLPNAFSNFYQDAIVLNSNRYQCMSYGDLMKLDVVGFAISQNGHLMFSVGKAINTALKLSEHLMSTETDLVIEYQCGTVIEDIDLSINYEKGDTLYIDSPLDVTSKHNVQMNTKAQVNECQKSLSKKTLALANKIRSLTDGKMRLAKDGYIAFPSAFGGLKLAWFGGNCEIIPGRETGLVIQTLPIKFTSFCRVFGCVEGSSDTKPSYYNVSGSVGVSTNDCYLEVKRATAPSENITVLVSIFAIGK